MEENLKLDPEAKVSPEDFQALPKEEELDAEKIKEVLSELDMWQRIADLPKGLETKIDDEGMFSGGQIRRISIARALLEDKPFIFLDEPFSDIDAKSQEILLRVLRRERRKRGIVIIAHTFDLIEKEDVVISLGGEKND